jgi:hypothetical protein
MQKFEKSIFIVIVTVALALPVVASWFLSQKMEEADTLMRKPIVALPESIGEWRRSHGVRDTAEPNVIRAEYCNRVKRRLFVILQRGSTLGPMHDLYDCLVATGGVPTVIRSETVSNTPTVLNASLIRTKIVGACSISASAHDTAATINQLPESTPSPPQQDLHRFLSLMWFQNSIASASSRWQWRYMQLHNPWSVPLVYYQVEVTVHESPDLDGDASQLRKIATRLHELPL